MNTIKMEQVFPNVTCEDFSQEGKGIAFIDSKKVFIENFLPAEEADIKITHVSKKFIQGEVVAFHKQSDKRRDPQCTHFGICGGCELQHLTYDYQCEMKEQQAKKTMQYGAKELDFTFDEIVPSPNEWHYRNKVFFRFIEVDGTLKPAFYKRQSHELAAVGSCEIIPTAMQAVADAIAAQLQGVNIEPYNEKTGKGIIKSICLRQNVDGDIMVVFIMKKEVSTQLQILSASILDAFPEVKTVVQNIHEKDNHQQMGTKDIVITGKGHIVETIFDHQFLVSPQSFYQVNHAQMENIYKKALSYLTDTDHTVIDFYCGVGTISILAANENRTVIGVEKNSSAIKQAKTNAKLNEVEDITFYAQDVETYMREYKNKRGVRPTVILDPPRTGNTKGFLTGLIAMNPKKIIYISCNPQTLSRDLLQLAHAGYKHSNVSLYDMFPQTTHVESVVCLEKE